MKLTLKIFALVAGLFCATTASASALYWQVTEATGATFEYAKLIATDGTTETVIDQVGSEGDGDGPNYVSLTSTDLGSYGTDTYSFFVEMCNFADTDPVKTSETASYQDLVSSGYVATGDIGATSAMASAANANFGTNPVPEPSSGLLLLMGGAILALRRRRQK